jgi:hypothetical protein
MSAPRQTGGPVRPSARIEPLEDRLSEDLERRFEELAGRAADIRGYL